MPQISKYKLPPLNSTERIGERIARLRKERGYTQAELAEKIGINRVLVSDYERNRIRPHYEMIIHLANSLEVTTDELLGIKQSEVKKNKPDLKIQRRMKRIERLPQSHKKAILKSIDMLLQGVENKV